MKKAAVLLVFLIGLGLWTCSPNNNSDSAQVWTEELVQERGIEITKTIGSTLVKTVQQQMSEGGVEAALSYCRVEALPITDSLAQNFNVAVKRTAQKTRNPANNPDDNERRILTQMSAQSEPKLVVEIGSDGKAAFYQPIILQPFCQTCHGTPGESMTLQTDSLIKIHYPEDRATGFEPGNLRGMWAVYFEKNQ